MESQVIGNVVAVTGKVVLEHNGESIVLEVGSPVFKGGVIKTGADSHIEVRFTDDTMLSQGANSEVSIDNFVFDQPDSASSILLNLTEGTLRTITGKIAEENPEGFEVKSPLATLGIRGTDFSVIHITRPTPKTDVILNQIGENHILIVSDQYGNIRYQNDPGTFVEVKADEPISIVEVLSEAERKEVLELTPFTTLPNNGITDEGNSLPDGSTIDSEKGADGQDNSQTDQDETDSSNTDTITAEPGASTSSGGSALKNLPSAGSNIPGTNLALASAEVSPLPDGIVESEATPSLDISPPGDFQSTVDQFADIETMLDNLPPTGAGPTPAETPVELFSTSLYDPFETSLTSFDPISQVESAIYQPSSTLYEPASGGATSYLPTSTLYAPVLSTASAYQTTGVSATTLQDPVEQLTGVESTPESDAVLVSAVPAALSAPPPSPESIPPPSPENIPPPSDPPPGTAPPTTVQPDQSSPPPAPTDPTQPPPDIPAPPTQNNDQTLVADDGGAILTGGTGNDTLYGGQGVDEFHGGAGNDSIVILGGFAPGVYSGTLPGNTDLAAGSPTYQADADHRWRKRL